MPCAAFVTLPPGARSRCAATPIGEAARIIEPPPAGPLPRSLHSPRATFTDAAIFERVICGELAAAMVMFAEDHARHVTLSVFTSTDGGGIVGCSSQNNLLGFEPSLGPGFKIFARRNC